MGVCYGGGVDPVGKDVKANKDDRYSVSRNCLYDDDGDKAGNEWKGAWLHSNPVEIDSAGKWDGGGYYAFEMSRHLRTPSEGTDAQLRVGEAIDFGFAFWVSLPSRQLSSPCPQKYNDPASWIFSISSIIPAILTTHRIPSYPTKTAGPEVIITSRAARRTGYPFVLSMSLARYSKKARREMEPVNSKVLSVIPRKISSVMPRKVYS